MKGRFRECTHSQFATQALDQIFRRPLFRTTDFVVESGIQKATAMTILRTLKGEGILNEFIAGSGSRPAVMLFPFLLNAAEGKEVF